MTIPKKMIPTPLGINTSAVGYDPSATSEFWQRLPNGQYLVYENVPALIALPLHHNANPDAGIAIQLAAYPRRVAAAGAAS